jgi:hypothetical protein
VNQTCRSVAVELAKRRVSEIISTRATHNDSSVLSTFTPYTCELRKACSLLDVSVIFFGHTVMRQLLALDHILIATEVANLLSDEQVRTTSSYSNISSFDTNSESFDRTILHKFDQEDSLLLLDAAVTLCSLVSKQQVIFILIFNIYISIREHS